MFFFVFDGLHLAAVFSMYRVSLAEVFSILMQPNPLVKASLL
jgi:hypothetical protein